VRWGRLTLLGLVALPVLEVWLALWLADQIGGWWTVGALAGLSALGLLVLRHGGRAAWTAFAAPIRAGQRPPDTAADGLVLLLGGLLLAVPGFLTGAAGLLLLVPAVRRAVRRGVARRVSASVVVVRASGPRPGPVIPGEVVEPDRRLDPD
jgi:UPF0716 protein FxsA